MCFYQNTYNLFLKNKDDKCKYNINKNLTHNLDNKNNLYLYKSIVGNKYINRGYRLNYDIKKTIKSLFAIHNETINIWTHLLPFFINIGIYLQSDDIHTQIFFLSTSPIFIGSALFHLLLPLINNLYQYHFLLLLDMLGIVLGVSGIEFYLYYKFINHYNTYFIIFFYFINLVPLINLFNFNKHVINCRNTIIKYLFSVNSIILYLILNNNTNNYLNNNFLFILFLNLVFIASLIFNMILHYPEKIYSNKFDLFFSSHQIWHLIVIFYIYGIFYIT
tara:strand:+ start:890 stop:1717 length:828 start_codon:yes stop_codon:yes gene_type:complete